MLLPLLLYALGGGDSPAGSTRTTSDPPTVSIRIEHATPYARGDRVRAQVRVRSGSYLTVVRIDTRGRIHLLYPASPRESGFVAGRNGLPAPLGFDVRDPDGA